ncbi:DUF3093 domain-containing protein [Herbiconiux sp. P15]|uniref:DUF3093 domain-containing protein n=1 Tax=Herbiconiux liukaitaii TaxID=3342799 RepID=UPI0035B704C9
MSHYRERLTPSLWVLASTALVVPASMIVFAPLPDVPGLLVGLVVGLVLYAGVLALLVGLAPVIEVAGSGVRVGRASIPKALVGECRAFTGEEATAERGPRLDARAFLCIRGWVGPVVKMGIADPQDPTPYWLVSTRRPGDLIEALKQL